MLLVVLFIYLFMPPLKIPIYHMVFIISFIYILLKIKKIFGYKKKKILYFNIVYITIILMYNIIIVIVNGKQLSNINSNIVSFFEIPIIAFAIIIYLKNNKKNFDELIERCFLVSFFQSILSILSFMLPKIQNFFVENFVFIGMGEIQKRNLRWLMDRRLYGLSNGLTYSTPIYQSIISGICYGSSRIQKKNYIYFILILFSSITNARIGFIVFILVFFIIFFQKINFQKIQCLFIMIIIAILLLIILMKVGENNTIKWIVDSFEEIAKLFEGKKVGTFSVLFGEDFLKVPEGLSLICGTGETVFGKEKGSDIGYINDLWYGGILYSIILWIFFTQNFLALFYSKIQSKFIELKTLSLIFLIVSIIVHIKGTFYAPSSYWNFIVLICVFNMVEENRKGR